MSKESIRAAEIETISENDKKDYTFIHFYRGNVWDVIGPARPYVYKIHV